MWFILQEKRTEKRWNPRRLMTPAYVWWNYIESGVLLVFLVISLFAVACVSIDKFRFCYKLTSRLYRMSYKVTARHFHKPIKHGIDILRPQYKMITHVFCVNRFSKNFCKSFVDDMKMEKRMSVWIYSKWYRTWLSIVWMNFLYKSPSTEAHTHTHKQP